MVAVFVVVVVFVRNGFVAVDLRAHAVSKGFCGAEVGGAIMPIAVVPLAVGFTTGGFTML